MLRIFFKSFNKVYFILFRGSKTGLRKATLVLAFLVVALAFIESSVVVYLREIFFPSGFSQPFLMIRGNLLRIEIGREFCTLVILVSLGYLMGKKFQERFAFFMFAFGLWDIFYYFWLWIFIGWPDSLLTWDLLFLIPVPWTGPVLAPLLISFSLVIVAVSTIYLKEKNFPIHLRGFKWTLEIIAGLIMIISFMWNYQHVNHNEIITSFPWIIFLPGFFLGWGVFISEIIRIKNLRLPYM